MTYRSEKEEDEVFYSLSPKQKEQYFREYEESGGNVRAALDTVVGPVWFDPDGSPKGRRFDYLSGITDHNRKPVHSKPSQ